MPIDDRDDYGRFLAYALNLGSAVSLVHDYAASGSLPEARRHKLEFALEHLRRFSRAEELLTASPGPIVPDLESVQVYRSVLKAMEAAACDFDPAHPGIAVSALVTALSQVLVGVSPSTVGIERLAALERTLDALASVYAGRAGALS